MYILGCDCTNITVIVENNAAIHQSSSAGSYEVSEKTNGETTWVSYSIALWYIPPVPYCPGFHGWVIGDLRDIGKPPIFEEGRGFRWEPRFIGRILLSGKNGRFSCPYEATNDIRFFNDDERSLELDINKDISIQCSDGNSKTFDTDICSMYSFNFHQNFSIFFGEVFGEVQDAKSRP